MLSQKGFEKMKTIKPEKNDSIITATCPACQFHNFAAINFKNIRCNNCKHVWKIRDFPCSIFHDDTGHVVFGLVRDEDSTLKIIATSEDRKHFISF